MKINNNDIDLDMAINYANIDNVLLKRRDNGFLLSDYQVEVLKRNGFDKDLAFGTGGLRGVIGAGTNRMNVHTVIKASKGIADYLNNEFDQELDLISSELAELIYYKDTKKWEDIIFLLIFKYLFS